MKENIQALVDLKIAKLNVVVDDAYISKEEGKNILNIVLDSSEIIDLNRVTDASRMINKIIDKDQELLKDIDEVDIFSKEKGDV